MMFYNVIHIAQVLANGYVVTLDIITLLSLLSATVYCVYGYKKDASNYFKAFILLLAIQELIRIPGIVKLGGVMSGINISDYLIFIAISFAVMCVLFMAENLGKKKSVILGLVALLLNILIVIKSVINGYYFHLMVLLPNVVLFAVLVLMILAKYYDKAERGTN